MNIMYFGSEPSGLRSIFGQGREGRGVDVFITESLDVAINELLCREFDCVLLDRSSAISAIKLLVNTSRLTGGNRPVFCSREHEDGPSVALTELIDCTIRRDHDLDLERVVEECHDHAANSSDALHPIIETLGTDSNDRLLAHIHRDGTYLWANQQLEESVGAPDGGLSGMPFEDFEPPHWGEEFRSVIESVITSGEIHWIGGNGSTDGGIYCVCPIDKASVFFFSHTPETSLAFGERYLNQIKDIFFIVNLDGDLLYWNGQMNRATGYSDVELLDLHVCQLFAPEERDEAKQRLKNVASNGDETVEVTLLTRDNNRIPYQISGSLIEETNGAPRYICGIGRDISERVEMRTELENAMEQLEESNAELERFAYVASHDLREPIRMVRSYLQLLESRYAHDLDENAQEFIEYAVDGAERMQRMIEDLLGYSRIGTQIRTEAVDIEDVLSEVRQNLRVSIDESGATVETGDLPTVRGDKTLLVQLFQNLIENAIEHAKSGSPHIVITAEPTGDRWEFAVEDESGGIPTHIQEEIFEMFTSGPSRGGVGIGLATCRKIVHTFGGEISVDSTPGIGSTFHFTLPRIDSQTP